MSGAAIPFIAMALLGTMVSAISNVIQKAMAEDPDIVDLTSKGLRANTRDPSAKLPIVYGTLRIGGNDVFIEAAGANNDNLWVVQTLSEGECDSIAPEDEDDSGSGDGVWLGEKLESEFDNYVAYWFHNGADDQTYDTNINAAIPKFNDNMRNTCYMVWKLIYNPNYFQNLPQRTILLKGKKLYDMRDNSTAWSDNPVLALYDFMTNDRYGFGFDSSRFDVLSWSSAATYCETKNWTINMRVDKDRSGFDVVDDMCALFRGQLVWYDGRFYLYYADLNYESSVMTLTDDNILHNDDGSLELGVDEPGSFDIPDGMRMNFVDKDKDYVDDSIPIGDEIGNIREITLNGCTSRQQASDLGTYMLERLKLPRTVRGTFRDDAIKLEPNDVVTLTSDTYYISNQLMRVISATIRPDGLIDLTLQYESILLYNDDYDADIEEVYDCVIPDPSEEPPGIENVSVTEETYFYRMRYFTRLDISFDEPSNYPWFDYVEVWISRDNTNWNHQFNATDDFSIENIEEGEGYYIRIKVVSIFGVKQQDINDYKIYHIVEGYDEYPPSLPGLNISVNQNSVNLYSVKLTDPDIEHYEFRTGVSWSGALFLAAMRAPNLSLSGVKPGSHTFWANTYSTNGLYGLYPQSAGCTLQDPPDGWTLSTYQECDYDDSDDVHDNTEIYEYEGEDYLRVDHETSSDPLTGIYKSTIYDLGSSARYMVYVLVDLIIMGQGTRWMDQFTVTDTWRDISADTKSWAELFNIPDSPSVAIRLNYGDTVDVSNTIEKMEILSTIVTARYYQVEIEITDPNPIVHAMLSPFTIKWCI